MVTNRSYLLAFAVSITLFAIVFSATTTGSSSTSTAQPTTSKQPTTQPKTTPGPTHPTSTLSPEQECHASNSSCDECIKAAKSRCFYCYADHSCQLYPLGDIVPQHCDLSKARWGVCWVNFEALIIAMSVIGGLIILTITCCCIRCCCCKGGNKGKYMKEEAKWDRQKTERKQRGEERKADRKERMDEIRRKYGLVKDDTPYQRFDA
ncbi:pituitary tumor-transforming gene 1 protein-interacting protein-like isoform X2 [Haliotis rufescens]|uniref:pituitary tumor-transforming gene 1 protein-interacting protein-like isoform X2 n=1 Tax=Haliotis rufescens TaxID=6454 RepID=UPI001EB006E1|nr:pituitary tumor-transforming gene 1 protein-interacting protein-like isoform X2 [Haliotis rufescens]